MAYNPDRRYEGWAGSIVDEIIEDEIHDWICEYLATGVNKPKPRTRRPPGFQQKGRGERISPIQLERRAIARAKARNARRQHEHN
jgi:hypothetical protein